MSWELEIDNIAGIRSGSASLKPGVNAVRGTNWKGKSSFVTAIETVMGTEKVVTEGEERGRVSLETDDGSVSVTLHRDGDVVTREGDPYLHDEKTRVAASLFTFLDDNNPVREAVRNDENLESVLTRPLDFENIDKQIADLTREREQVQTELERAQDAARKLPSVQEDVEQLKTEIDELESKRERLKDGGRDASSVPERRDELSDAKAERDSTESRIERLKNSVERLREKLADKRAELEDLEVPAVDGDHESEIADRRERLNELERDAELLQSVYAPTKRILDEDRLDLITDVERDIMADTVSCWTCGSESTVDDIETNIERLSDRISDLREKAQRERNEVERLQERQEKVRRAQRRRDDLEEAIADLESSLEERETSLERAREQYDKLQSNVEELSETVEAEDDALTDVESEIKYAETQLEEKQEELETLENRSARREQLEDEREELTAEINRLRDRKAELKRRLRDAFDDAIQDVLTRFDVGFEMVRLTSEFDLVVARNGREARLSALSEGELELLGVVAALAGYEAFDVTDEIPVMLLDSLGGFADDNLQTLVEYLQSRAEFIVFTTYPENTTFEGNTIDPTDWDVVSPDANPVASTD